MKKSLIALAALAATASFAQSSVTISGVVDYSFSSTSGSDTNATTKLSTVNQSNTSATSSINLGVVEDLGGGMKAVGLYEIDPRAWSNGGTNNLARHQSFVGLDGGFGSIKLGSPNAASLQAYLASSPLGTGIGSGFSLSDHTAVTAAGVVRYSNSVRYDTPNMSGFAASVTYAPGNKDATTGGTSPAITNVGLSYGNGPLNVVFSSLGSSATAGQLAVDSTCIADLETGVITTPGCSLGTAAVAAAKKSTYNFLGANYAMGNFKLFGGYGTGTKNGQDVKVERIAATYTVGAVTLIGQYATTEFVGVRTDKTTGLRADYALSKRTAAYVGYQSFRDGADGKHTNITAVGVRHAF